VWIASDGVTERLGPVVQRGLALADDVASRHHEVAVVFHVAVAEHLGLEDRGRPRADRVERDGGRVGALLAADDLGTDRRQVAVRRDRWRVILPRVGPVAWDGSLPSVTAASRQ
jgi:hypothetical protein